MADPGSLVTLLLAATALCAAALLLVRTVPSERAAARHQLWTVALAGALVLPLLQWALPAYLTLPGLPVPASAEVGDTPSPAGPAPTAGAAILPAGDRMRFAPAGPAVAPAVDAPGRAARPAATSSGVAPAPSWAGMLSALWLLGALAGTAGLMGSHLAAARLARRSTPARRPWDDEAAQAARRLGLSFVPQVRWVDELDVPVAAGLWRPSILLPSAARHWPRARRLAVLLHESAHLRRGDLWSRLVGELARAVYWFHPLVWLAAERQRDAAERACDQAVLAAGVAPYSYARDLLAISHQARLPHLGATLAFGRRRRLRDRLDGILSFRRGPLPPGRPALLATLMLLITLFGLACVGAEPERPAGAAQQASRETTRLSTALDQLTRGEAAARSHAAWILGQLESPRATAALHAALDDPQAEVRVMAAWALGEIKSPRSVPVLIDALTERDPLALEMIVKALGEIEDPRASGELADVLSRQTATPDLRRAAVWSLGEIARRQLGHGAMSSKALRTLETVLNDDPDAGVRAAAARAIPSDPATTPLLLAALDDPDAGVRRTAAQHLGRSRPGASAAEHSVPALIHALEDPSPEVRREAATGLGRLQAPAAADALIAHLRDDHPAVRDAATWALDELTTD